MQIASSSLSLSHHAKPPESGHLLRYSRAICSSFVITIALFLLNVKNSWSNLDPIHSRALFASTALICFLSATIAHFVFVKEDSLHSLSTSSPYTLANSSQSMCEFSHA